MKQLALVLAILHGCPWCAEQPRHTAQLPFRVVPDFFQIPDSIWMAGP